MRAQSEAIQIDTDLEIKKAPRTSRQKLKRWTAEPKAQFLKNNEELLLIALPWIGAILTLGFWALSVAGFDFRLHEITILISTVIFLDSVHILWTYVLLLSSPELRSWTKNEKVVAKTGWMKGRGPWGQSLLIAGALAAVYYFMKGSFTFSTLRGMATTWLLIDLIGPAQHTLAQMKGISLCYNSSLKRTFPFTDAEKIVAARAERLERWFFQGLLWGEILYWLPEIFGEDQIELPGMDALQSVGGVLILGGAVALLVNALYYPRHEESRKFAFLFRVMLFPLKMVNVMGGIAVRAAHGTEYLFVFRRMMQGSNLPKLKRTKIYLATAALSLVYLIPFTLSWTDAFKEISDFKPDDLLLAWSLGLVFVLRFTHYYMDAVLFRMSQPETRMIVGPLLTSPPNTIQD